MTQFNPIELLLELSSTGSCGYLAVNSNSVSWKIYLQGEKLKYAECSIQTLDQLKYYLLHQGWKDAVAALKDMPQTYLKSNTNSEGNSEQNLFEKAIIWLQAEKHLDNSQILQLLEDITQDALESCLWLDEGTSSWQEEEAIPPWIKAHIGDSFSLDLSDLITFLQQRLKGWQNCASALISPHQRPYFLDYRDIDKSVASGGLSRKALTELAQVMRRGLSFRQLSLFIHKDELHVAQILSPYIKNQLIHLRNPQPPLDRLPHIPRLTQDKTEKNISAVSQPDKIYKIVCIDDSPTILSEIQRFLGEKRFQVTAINDPVQASSVIFRIKPDLVLLDITMPRINGYRLCGLLRTSRIFDETPIIMVTGNTGLIDKARAKLAGATDYFTKPFTKEGLMAIIEKHLE